MLLAYTLVTELVGVLIRDFESFQIVYEENYHFANYIVYNIYDIVFFVYFYFLFWRIVNNLKSKLIIKIGAILYIIATLVNPFFQNIYIFPQLFASTIGSIVLMIAILLYFIEIKKQKEKKHNLMIWISAGLLVFNLFFPLISIAARYDYELYQNLYFRQIHFILIVFMYACFIFGFLFMRRIGSEGEN